MESRVSVKEGWYRTVSRVIPTLLRNLILKEPMVEHSRIEPSAVETLIGGDIFRRLRKASIWLVKCPVAPESTSIRRQDNWKRQEHRLVALEERTETRLADQYWDSSEAVLGVVEVDSSEVEGSAWVSALIGS